MAGVAAVEIETASFGGFRWLRHPQVRDTSGDILECSGNFTAMCQSNTGLGDSAKKPLVGCATGVLESVRWWKRLLNTNYFLFCLLSFLMLLPRVFKGHREGTLFLVCQIVCAHLCQDFLQQLLSICVFCVLILSFLLIKLPNVTYSP